jgi:hypothetical protein
MEKWRVQEIATELVMHNIFLLVQRERINSSFRIMAIETEGVCYQQMHRTINSIYVYRNQRMVTLTLRINKKKDI